MQCRRTMKADTYDVERAHELVVDWMDDNVYGKGYEITAIAGDVVVELTESWSEDDVEAAAFGMDDYGIPVYATRGTRQIRVGQ